VVKAVRGIRCPSPGFGEGGKVNSCPDAIAQALLAHLEKMPQMGAVTKASDLPSMAELAHCPECPECGSTGLEFGEGCVFCRSCGFSRCG
ncbi:MAG: TSCPD domain-containing protein, partial [Thermoleophilia bacterium]